MPEQRSNLESIDDQNKALRAAETDAVHAVDDAAIAHHEVAKTALRSPWRKSSGTFENSIDAARLYEGAVVASKRFLEKNGAVLHDIASKEYQEHQTRVAELEATKTQE